MYIYVIGDAMGIIQHHDAVSGTEAQHVADDYALRLSQGIDDALVSVLNIRLDLILSKINFIYFQIVINNAYSKLLQKESQSLPIVSNYICQLLNISECLPIERQERVYLFIAKDDFTIFSSFQFTLTLWNPTVHSVTSFVRIPITNDYTVTDPDGNKVLTEVNLK